MPEGIGWVITEEIDGLDTDSDRLLGTLQRPKLSPFADEGLCHILTQDWIRIAAEPVSEEGLLLVYLSVYQDPNTVKKPVTFSMTRIMLDESLMTTETEDML